MEWFCGKSSPITESTATASVCRDGYQQEMRKSVKEEKKRKEVTLQDLELSTEESVSSSGYSEDTEIANCKMHALITAFDNVL